MKSKTKEYSLYITVFCLFALLVYNFGSSQPKTTGKKGAYFEYAKPEEVGVASASLDQITEEIKKWVENGDPVGAEFLVIKNRKIIKHETFGWMNREEKIPVKRNTICRIRSMTKPFIGTAVLMLAEEGKLKIDDPISKYLPSFDNEKSGKITIRQMLTHTAGFRQDAYPRPLSVCKSLREAVDIVGKQGPPDQPGTKFTYSDKDSSTLGAVVAEVSGVPVEEFIQTRLFTPLGMKNSFCNYKETDPRRGNVSCTYRKTSGGFVKYWDPSQPQRLKFFRASGGIYSTPIDYAKFLLMWMNKGQLDSKRFLSEVSVKKALEYSLLSTKGALSLSKGYGMHWSIFLGGKEGYLPWFGHSGSDGTMAFAVPDQDLMVFYFTQSRRGATVFQLGELVYRKLLVLPIK